ncbi:MAG: HAD hydrolase family protein [Chitinophagaceae bacterium]|nr:HAD hydrolase family protein [Chitinophagaceae bacterium]
MNVLQNFKNVRHFVFDIDGVLTNSQLLINSDGMLLRSMHIKDGYAMQLAIKQGYSISIISGAKGDHLLSRFHHLGIQDIHLGVDDKLPVFTSLALDPSTCLYMGDDMPDVSILKQVYLPCCPSDAVEEVKQIASYVSPYQGGMGCVRDVIEKVLKLNKHWK